MIDRDTPAKKSLYNQHLEGRKNVAQRDDYRRDFHTGNSVAATDEPLTSKSTTNIPPQMIAQVRSNEKPHQSATSVSRKPNENQSETKNPIKARPTGDTEVRSVDNQRRHDHDTHHDFSFTSNVSKADFQNIKHFSNLSKSFYSCTN